MGKSPENPRATQGLPKGYPRYAQGMLKGCPREQHRSNTGATPEQHRSNTGATPEQHRSIEGALRDHCGTTSVRDSAGSTGIKLWVQGQLAVPPAWLPPSCLSMASVGKGHSLPVIPQPWPHFRAAVV